MFPHIYCDPADYLFSIRYTKAPVNAGIGQKSVVLLKNALSFDLNTAQLNPFIT